jgi:hypothetical protein
VKSAAIVAVYFIEIYCDAYFWCGSRMKVKVEHS